MGDERGEMVNEDVLGADNVWHPVDSSSATARGDGPEAGVQLRREPGGVLLRAAHYTNVRGLHIFGY